MITPASVLCISATALDIVPLGYREVFRTRQNGEKTHWVAFDFKVLVDPQEVKIGEPDMLDEIGWFTFDTLPSPLHSQMQHFFEKYKEFLR